MASDNAVEFARVSATRGTRRVLRQVSIAIGAGEVVALVGRSGSGKTTLLRLINRLIDPEEGEILVDGRPVAAWDVIELRRRTGYVIQDTGLFPHMTVAANVATVPRLLAWPDRRITARVDELLTMVGLDPVAYRRRWPDELSGGERQRVGLARALAADPPLLLMDEPFGALDPITRADLHDQFRELQRRLRRAVVLVTHDIAEAFALANRIAVLHDGEIITCAAPDAVAASSDPRVAALVRTR